MPFARDKPRLVERLRGKTGQDLFNQVKSALNSDSRRMLFNSPPSWADRSFPRGFPFDEEDPSFFTSSRFRPFGEQGTNSGITDDIQEPPPFPDENESRFKANEQEEPVKSPQPEGQTSRLSHHGLRNTVPFAQAPHTERPARAMSAPPGDRPQRFTSSCEIPVNEPNQPPAPQQPTNVQGSNVRVIPIRVEGRDEPLINNIGTSSNFESSPPASGFAGRMPRNFGNYQKQSPRFQQQPAQTHKPPAAQPKSQPAPEPKMPDETDTPSQAAPADPTVQAMKRIAQVQEEVEKLGKQVESATVASRSEKDFIYLDEMLTRQLLHLDNVDPQGHDNVRQARKDAIRSIQKCISVLESKVTAESMQVQESAEESKEAEPEPMATESKEPSVEKQVADSKTESIPPGDPPNP